MGAGKKIFYVPSDLERLDGLEADSIALPMYFGKIQPQGVAGLVDWRMGGRLGKQILIERFLGELDDRLLMPTQGRIAPERIFLFGLGAGSTFALEAAKDILTMLHEAGATKLALGLPECEAQLDITIEAAIESPIDPDVHRWLISKPELWLMALDAIGADFERLTFVGTFE